MLQKCHAQGSQFKNELNISKFSKYLQYKKTSEFDMKLIQSGAPLWLSFYGKFDQNGKPITPNNLSTRVSNLLLKKSDIYAIFDKFIEECKAGQIEPIHKNTHNQEHFPSH